MDIFIASHSQPWVQLALIVNEKSGEQEFKKSFTSILGFTQYKSNSGDKSFHAMTSDYLILSPFIFLVFVEECTTVDTDFIITWTMRFS